MTDSQQNFGCTVKGWCTRAGTWARSVCSVIKRGGGTGLGYISLYLYSGVPVFLPSILTPVTLPNPVIQTHMRLAATTWSLPSAALTATTFSIQPRILPRGIKLLGSPPAAKMMSILHPRFGHTTPSSSPYSSPHPGFSSLFRMLDDFERYAQQAVTSPIGNIGGLISPSSATTGTSTTSPGGSLIPSMQSMPLAIAPKFDVSETDREYSLQGELPGVPPENVIIEFTDPQTLVIRGHAERERTEGDPSLAPSSERKRIDEGKDMGTSSSSSSGKDRDAKMKEGKMTKKDESSSSMTSSSPPSGSNTKYWLNERSFGEFSRVFNFPMGVDQDKVEAKFNHGLLSVTVPKMEKKGTRKIEIK